jgi:hypothetical protein
MLKLHALYTVVNNEEVFIGQAYLSQEDLDAIDQSFANQLEGEYGITLTDGDVIDVSKIDSVEEIDGEEE